MYMFALILTLLVVSVVLCVQFGSNYYTQVKVVRRFFKNKGSAPEETLAQTELQKDLTYGSVLPGGTFDLYRATDAEAKQPVLVWVHGGGYVGGDKSCAEPWARVLAAHLHVAVASINYCLAPEQHYPGPLLQLDEALRHLAQSADRYGLDVTRVFLAGDSAGAQIVSQYAALVCNEDLCVQMHIQPVLSRPHLRGILLCCGFYNMDTVMHAHFPAMKTFLWAYTNVKHIRKFARKDEMSAVKQVTPDYCDVYLTCGDADPFRKQADELLDALSFFHIPAETYLPRVRGKKLGHEYQFAVGSTEADIALEKAEKFIAARI